jgi:beta-glucosidase
MIRSYYEVTPLEGLENKLKDKIEIIDSPSDADSVIIFAGLDHNNHMDKENKDRKNLSLPEDQIELIKEISKLNSNTIIVLINGSPISMESWIKDVPAIIEAWYAGMESGNVIADIIFGDINPSGKLPITFPKSLKDSPAHKSERTYPGNDKVYYDEGIYVGYRHFDKHNIEPLFPFGFGLSYTTFKIDSLLIESEKISKGQNINFSVNIVNTGNRSGSEVIQIYIEPIKPTIDRPPKELKSFEKIHLKPKESKTINFDLEPNVISYFNPKIEKWVIDKGFYKILIGTSSRNIIIEREIEYLG